MFDGLKYRALQRLHDEYMADVSTYARQINHINRSEIMVHINRLFNLIVAIVHERQNMMAELNADIDNNTLAMTAHMRNVA
jgi:hypothetical protein